MGNTDDAARAIAPADLRADLARNRLKVYEVAVDVGMHPARLGAMLSERIPMPRDVAQRLQEVIRTFRQERAG